MIIPDLNLLLYACITAFEEHEAARRWLEDIMNGEEDVGLAAPALFGFIRLSTNPRVFDSPLSVEEAIAKAQGWIDRPHVHFLLPGPRHLELAFGILKKLGTAANLTTDVQLAALAIEHQAELHSNDGDFDRIPQLRWVNPLGASPARPKRSGGPRRRGTTGPSGG